jgi:mono/diheme cytochrome c family protein
MTDQDTSKTGRYLIRAGQATLVLFLVVQLYPYGRDHHNPPVTAEPPWDSQETRATFLRVCGDCHSNETDWPWYSHVAPVSWLVAHDVEDARSELNVSEWGREHHHGDEAAEELEEGEMPLWFYTPLHPETSLTDEEKEVFLRGLIATFGEAEHEE